MLEKPAKTLVPIHDLISKRWSPRAFDPNKTVSRPQIVVLLEAARWAPSCFGDEPWRYIVCNKASNPAAWDKAFSCLAEANQLWVKNVPLLILATSNSHFKHNSKPNRWAQYDTGAASENICLQAYALGLAAHQMGGFSVNKAREVFNIPKEIECMAMIAVGYQATPDLLPEDYKNRELAERQRVALEQQFFEGTWGAPLAEK